MIAMGFLAMFVFLIRFVAFTVFESPEYLMGRGKDEEAVRVVHEVASRNGKTSMLTLEDLKMHEHLGQQNTDAAAPLSRKLEKLNLTQVRALFSNTKLALSTTLIIWVWAFIGLGFPLYNSFLPFIQAEKGAQFGDGSTYITYRDSLIIAVLGISGALFGGLLVELPRFGRKGALSLSTILTGVFLYLSTTALNSNALLGWNCGYHVQCVVCLYASFLHSQRVRISHEGGACKEIRTNSMLG